MVRRAACLAPGFETKARLRTHVCLQPGQLPAPVPGCLPVRLPARLPERPIVRLFITAQSLLSAQSVSVRVSLLMRVREL